MLSPRLDPRPDPRLAPDPLVRVAVCGEVRSGKSTVVNLLLRENLLPASNAGRSRPLIVVRHGDAPAMVASYPDGSTSDLSAGAQAAAFDGPVRIDVTSPCESLRGFEIVEVPLTRSEDLTEAQRAVVASAQVMIWVTIASQAWRLTEKSIVEAFGVNRPDRGIIAASRADKLRNDNDRGRLRDRIVRETSNLFGECVLIHGARRMIEQSAKSGATWAETSGADLQALLDLHRADLGATAASTHKVSDALTGVLDLSAYRVMQETEAAAPEGPKPGDGLRELAQGLQGLTTAGLASTDGTGDCIVLLGDPAQGRAVAAACLTSYEALVACHGFEGAGGEVESAEIVTPSHRLLYQTLPGPGRIVFLSCDASTSAGIARNNLSRLRKAAAV